MRLLNMRANQTSGFSLVPGALNTALVAAADRVLTISHWEVVPVLHLKAGCPPIILTDADFLALDAAFGGRGDWAGHKVTLSLEEDQVPRVHPIKPKPASASAGAD
jgi:hypothetical protein